MMKTHCCGSEALVFSRTSCAAMVACVLGVLSTTASASAQNLTSSISQYGITWTFDRPVQHGRFVNGDYWVIGPVTVVGIAPAPGAAPRDEVNDFGPNKWGDSGVRNDVRTRNGSMVVMTPAEAQGYDARGLTYDARASVSLPLTLDVDRSLVSSVSNVVIPNRQMHRDIMWAAEKSGLQLLKTAAVLTVLAEPPRDDAFRPSYVGRVKRIFRLGDVRWERLLRLPMEAYRVPSWAQFERYFERWLDHLNGD